MGVGESVGLQTRWELARGMGCNHPVNLGTIECECDQTFGQSSCLSEQLVSAITTSVSHSRKLDPHHEQGQL